MAETEFPPYSISYSLAAREARRALTPARRAIADQVESELSWNPDAHGDRIRPTSGDDRSSIYRDPATGLELTYQVDRERKILFFCHYAAPTVQAPMVFISYSHRDKRKLEQLKKFLQALEQSGALRFWDDSQLTKGRPWKEQIEEVLDGATAGLLLVSQDFLASRFIGEKELPVLLEAARRGKRIYWLQLSQSTVFETHDEITQFQAIVEDPRISLDQLPAHKRNEAMVAVVRTLKNDFGSA